MTLGAAKSVLLAVELDLTANEAAARAAYRKALSGMRTSGPQVDGWAAVALNNLGVLEAKNERYDRAMTNLRASCELNRRTGDTVSLLINLCNLATVAGAAGAMTEAAIFRSKALKARVAIGARNVEPIDSFVPGNLSRLMDIKPWLEAEDDSSTLTPPPLPSRDSTEPMDQKTISFDELDAFYGPTKTET